jgi:hypothetical protein
MGRTLTDIHQTLVDELETLVTGDDWLNMLHTASRFHRYSARNILLIQAQRPDATRVAGYTTWKGLGRQVRKGAHGIAVLAPCTYRTTDTDTDTARTLKGFRVAHVFDVSDTDGDPLPEVDATLLTGDAPAGLWDAISEQVVTLGYSLDRENCSPANGVTRFTTRQVSIRPDLDPAQAVKTLTHELGHILCGHGDERDLDRDRAEVEAESVAHIVCTAAGLTTTSYSYPYVAHWSGGNLDLVRATADQVIKVARQILDGLPESTLT